MTNLPANPTLVAGGLYHRDMGDEIGRNTAWFYCLKHGTVEREGECKATDRLGPYPDPEQAAHALETFRAREERLEAEDRAWAGDDSGVS